MKVTEILKKEYEKLADDLRGKVVYTEPEIKFINLIKLAEEQGSFDRKQYVFSDDVDTIYDMLNFSIGLSSLWKNFREEHPKADIREVNEVIVQYLINMWGLEKISIPIEKFRIEGEE